MIGHRTRLLARTFFGRLFENDLFASSISASNGAVWLLAGLATPGVMFSGSQMYYYAHVRTFTPAAQDRVLFTSQVFHVGFAMAMAGRYSGQVRRSAGASHSARPCSPSCWSWDSPTPSS